MKWNGLLRFTFDLLWGNMAELIQELGILELLVACA